MTIQGIEPTCKKFEISSDFPTQLSNQPHLFDQLPGLDKYKRRFENNKKLF